MRTVTRALTHAVRDRRVETVLDCFDPGADSYVFLEGPRWTNRPDPYSTGDRLPAGPAADRGGATSPGPGR